MQSVMKVLNDSHKLALKSVDESEVRMIEAVRMSHETLRNELKKMHSSESDETTKDASLDGGNNDSIKTEASTVEDDFPPVANPDK